MNERAFIQNPKFSCSLQANTSLIDKTGVTDLWMLDDNKNYDKADSGNISPQEFCVGNAPCPCDLSVRGERPMSEISN